MSDSEPRMFGLSILLLLTNIMFFYMLLPTRDPLAWNSRDYELFINKSRIAVPGQEKAAEQIISVFKNNSQNHELLFFLGGPGVGKSEMSNTIKEIIHDKSKLEEPKTIKHRSIKHVYKMFDQEFIFKQTSFCDIKYFINNDSDKLVLSIDHITNFIQIIEKNETNTLAIYYQNEINCLKVFNMKFTHIVITDVVNDKDLELMMNSEDYEKHVQKIARNLEETMLENAPDVKFHIIIFKPLDLEQVLKTETYINETKLHESFKLYEKWDESKYKMYQNYVSKDFIPHGRKMLQYLENYKLKSFEHEFSYLDD